MQKTCTKCGEEKPVSEFYKKRNGLTSQCKSCILAYKADAYQNNKQAKKDYNKNYYWKNKSDLKEKSKQNYELNRDNAIQRMSDYYKNNKETFAAYNKDYYQKNRDAKISYSVEWAKKNKAIKNAQVAKRHAAKLNATPSWLTAIHKAQLQEFYDLAIAKTVQTGIEYHVDHIHPLQGDRFNGLHVPWNLQILSATENMSKGNKLIEGE